MINLPKIRKIFDITLTLSFVIGYFYVQSALKVSNVPVKNVIDDDEKVMEVKSAHPQLILNLNGTTTVYNATMRNTETVEDFLSKLVAEKSLSFEKVGYRYGTEIDFLNGQQAPAGKRWAIFKNDKDITYLIGDENLDAKPEHDVYVIKLVDDK